APLIVRPSTTRPGVLDAIVEVEERYDDYGAIEFAGGYATDYGAYFSPRYIWRNIFGRGWSFEGGGTIGQYRRDVSGRIVDPRLGGQRIRFEISGYARQEDTVRLGSINTFDGAITVSRELLP